MYDIIFLGTPDDQQYLQLKQRFPIAKFAHDLESAKQKAITEFFYIVWNDIEIDDSFDFDYTIDEYSKDYTHVFLNNEKYDGVCLLNKNCDISDRELQYRFFNNKKETNIAASNPVPYEIFYVDTYEQYREALETSKQDMFWIVPNTVDVIEDFDFTWWISHHEQYDRRINHVFLNGEYHDGVILCSKHLKISKREWDFKFIAGKKEHNVLASTPKPYDIVFISYQEPNAEENYARILKRFPDCKRVHGVKGIHQAHIEGAKLCNTPMFWIVDGDAVIQDDFDFEYQVPAWQYNHVHVWRSKNPINGLVYGYGGVKLFPTELTISMDTTKPDMTTSISDKFVAVNKVSNITAFNTGEFETWKSAFRECAKLASKTIARQKTEETDARLKIWTTIGRDKQFGEYAIRGARAGMEFGVSNSDNLQLINDFDWLKEKFNGNL